MRKRDKYNYEFIKEKFDNADITSPVDEDAAAKLIEGAEQKKEKFIGKHALIKALVSAAACLALILAAVTVNAPDLIYENGKDDSERRDSAAFLSFSSYDEIEAYMDDIANAQDYCYNVSKDVAQSVSDTAESTVADGAFYAETYKQHDGVDEADIIKTDGEYIYYADTAKGIIGIYKARGEDTVLSAQINEFNYTKASDDSYWIQDMFVCDDDLIVNVGKTSTDRDNYKTYSNTYIYDLTLPEEPALKKAYSQSGDYVSSRMIGKTLYIVSNQYIDPSECKTVEDYVPCVSDNEGEMSSLKAENISYIDGAMEPNYILITAIDTAAGNHRTESRAVLGVGSEVYCNVNNMYVAGMIYKTLETEERTTADILSADIAVAPIRASTFIVRLSLDSDIAFTASGIVEGSLNDQFSMDEHNGCLRVATTSYTETGEEINNLYVLDENLKKIGEVTGFAAGESIKAVKFIEDTVYVITYKETDPLFIIDLSDPKNPQIMGSVEISGFSTMLVPVSDHMILGIGYSDEETQSGIVTNGLKLTLFDITDAKSPKVLDSRDFEGYDSQVQYNHKALVVNPDEEYYAFAYADFSNASQTEIGIVAFEISGGKISIKDHFKTQNDYYNDPRCTYIGDTIYLLNGYKNVAAFKVND